MPVFISNLYRILLLVFSMSWNLNSSWGQSQNSGLDPAKPIAQYHKQNWTTENGLPSNAVQSGAHPADRDPRQSDDRGPQRLLRWVRNGGRRGPVVAVRNLNASGHVGILDRPSAPPLTGRIASCFGRLERWPVVELATRLALDQKIPGSSPGGPISDTRSTLRRGGRVA